MQTHDDRLLASAQKLLDDVVDCSTDDAGNIDRYDSPIEYLLARAFGVLLRLRYPQVLIDCGANLTTALVDEQLVDSGPRPIFVLIVPQFKIGPYRVDFAVRYISGLEGAAGLVVECDGHAFHEKTKEQAARDKSRDRFLAAAGYRVMRFTGSEIWADPISCAEQVLDATYHKALDACNARACWRHGDIEGAARELAYMAKGDLV